MSIPSFERLESDVGRLYVFSGEWEGHVEAELRYVRRGVPMNARHCCYSAKFALPAGIGMSQATCTVSAGADSWDHLLVTPMGPDDDGRQLIQMVFHYPIVQAQAAAAPAGA